MKYPCPLLSSFLFLSPDSFQAVSQNGAVLLPPPLPWVSMLDPPCCIVRSVIAVRPSPPLPFFSLSGVSGELVECFPSGCLFPPVPHAKIVRGIRRSIPPAFPSFYTLLLPPFFSALSGRPTSSDMDEKGVIHGLFVQIRFPYT